jgi:hypothetical protein
VGGGRGGFPHHNSGSGRLNSVKTDVVESNICLNDAFSNSKALEVLNVGAKVDRRG